MKQLIKVDLEPSNVLEKDEFNVVTDIKLIKESLIVPKHDKSIKTIILKKLVTENFKISNFVKNLMMILKFPYEIRIGFSFIAQNEKRKSYCFAIKPHPINNEFKAIRNSLDAKKLETFLSSFQKDELLNFVFEQASEINPFEESAYRPHKLVLLVAWVTKHVQQN